MPNTPPPRNTRSNSNAQNISLNDIKSLIEERTSVILKTVKEDIGDVKKEIMEMKETISSLVERIRYLEGRSNFFETKVANLERDIQDIKSKQVWGLAPEEEIFHEAEERIKRRKYLIVSGAQEKASETVEERWQYDREILSRAR